MFFEDFHIETEPLEGEWSQEAEDLFDLDYILGIPPGQGDYMQRREMADYWLAMARKLKIRGEYDADILRNFQEYVAVTPPQERCPCKHGVELANSLEHYPRCDNIRAHVEREFEQRRIWARERELREQEEANERRRQMEIEQARDIHRQWSMSIATHLRTESLQKIRDDCEKELQQRYKTPTH